MSQRFKEAASTVQNKILKGKVDMSFTENEKFKIRFNIYLEILELISNMTSNKQSA